MVLRTIKFVKSTQQKNISNLQKRSLIPNKK